MRTDGWIEIDNVKQKKIKAKSYTDDEMKAANYAETRIDF